jgi:ribose transport system ATP-binding protein
MTEPFLEMRNITKDFPGVRALDSATISIKRGEVRALLGENGAGKSTLIKILSGVYRADHGEIRLEGTKREIGDPLQALRLGIGAIYQEFNLVPQLTVAENIMLGMVPRRWGSIDSIKMHQRAKEVLGRLGVQLDTHLIVGQLTVAQQQIVEIAKALIRELQILIMDEPTASLNRTETVNLFNVIRGLSTSGVSILYISHRLREVFEIADSVTVLKDGIVVDTKSINEVNRDELVRMMIGRHLADYYPIKDTATEEIILRVQNLGLKNELTNINLELHRGEILGIVGLEGQGQRELAQAIAGAIPYDSGDIYLKSRVVRNNTSRDAMNAGIGYVPDDRKQDGLVLVRSANENITLPSLRKRLSYFFLIDAKRERSFVGQLVEKLNIKLTDRFQIVRNLSGGNQQKVVVAKWLGNEPEVLVVAEPTRGIDVGSKSEIHFLMRDLTRQGVGIIMVSSELPEVLGMSDRIIVMAHGKIAAEMSGVDASEESIMAAATKDIAPEDITI